MHVATHFTPALIASMLLLLSTTLVYAKDGCGCNFCLVPNEMTPPQLYCTPCCPLMDDPECSVHVPCNI
ncbi:hypothetical protein EJ03DRAFT_323500 [Teratosphaeria nubilosa]|uniref:Uncharacterized protein n=1 Tax=Teratosphaeria nubilosa TaxID=161662 RepID=A0A6G1LKT2_9PEZI|nr:hypothetical protein EJ03DRAFT_323500 [Teratosphaeria nubilosa]